MRDPDCPFCGYTEGVPDGQVKEVQPLNPVTDGHMLFIPSEHFETAYDSPALAARVLFAAASYMRDVGAPQGNWVVNGGPDAGQTVSHFHLHFVPRTPGDGLKMPWDH